MECSCLRPYGLHRFPGRVEDEDVWVKYVNRDGFEPNKNTVVSFALINCLDLFNLLQCNSAISLLAMSLYIGENKAGAFMLQSVFMAISISVNEGRLCSSVIFTHVPCCPTKLKGSNYIFC